LPYVPFDLALARDNARRIHPDVRIVELSCTTGEGLDGWLGWLKEQREAARVAATKQTG
jgi:hydrogenase nickel incorporation protein HypB